MATIQVQVQDELIQQLGLKAINQLLEEELVYQRFKILENRIQSTMRETQDVNWELEFENARQQTYAEYIQRRKSAA